MATGPSASPETVHPGPVQFGNVKVPPALNTVSGPKPFSRAVAMVKPLNDEPGCIPVLPPRARLTWLALKSRPPTSAFTNPVDGSTLTIDISNGGPVPARPWATDCSASCWRCGSIVVCTVMPPRYTLSGPYFSSRYWRT